MTWKLRVGTSTSKAEGDRQQVTPWNSVETPGYSVV